VRFWIGLGLSTEEVTEDGKGGEGSGANGLGVLAYMASRLSMPFVGLVTMGGGITGWGMRVV
jgi:hypothetical protein